MVEERNGDFIFNTFIKLTSKTYPFGYEDGLVSEMLEIGLFPKDLQKDTDGNYFIKIGESRTIFSSHFDTACKLQSDINHVVKGNIIKTDGKTILGADDKAGVTVMLYMIKNNIPGLYYFFVGEEVGCVGSKLVAKFNPTIAGNYDRMISFDRRDTFSVITYQSSTRCCSDEFADQLASELNFNGMKYRKDDTGVYTDSAEFVYIIPECTNLSVGYDSEHTFYESQDIEHLRKLAEACLKVNWEKLVTRRDKTKIEYKSWAYEYPVYGKSEIDVTDYVDGKPVSYKKTYGYNDDFYDEDDDYDRYKKTRRGKKSKPKTFRDNGDGYLEEIFTDKKQKELTFSHSYDWIMDKFLNGNLSLDELDELEDQYFDLSRKEDKEIYDFLLQRLSDPFYHS